MARESRGPRLDVNGDGFEDLLLFMSYRVTDGTYGDYRYVCLEWTDKEARPALVDCAL